ncbi:hypothetical protein ACM6PT_30590, partial [Klebsiella pneumoniae]
VVDCAGHGVPGALMTMLARAAIDHAIEAVGSRDPAAILGETDQAMRSMLSQARPSWNSCSGETIEEDASPREGRSSDMTGEASMQASVNRAGRSTFMQEAQVGKGLTLAVGYRHCLGICPRPEAVGLRAPFQLASGG